MPVAGIACGNERSDVNFCPRCGTPVSSSANFCSGCGTPFVQPTAGPAPEPTARPAHQPAPVSGAPRSRAILPLLAGIFTVVAAFFVLVAVFTPYVAGFKMADEPGSLAGSLTF